MVSQNLFHRVQSTSGGTINFQISEEEADERAQLLCEELELPYEDLCLESLRAIPLVQLTAAFCAVQKKPTRFAGPAWPAVS